jgi:hypothetical protein
MPQNCRLLVSTLLSIADRAIRPLYLMMQKPNAMNAILIFIRRLPGRIVQDVIQLFRGLLQISMKYTSRAGFRCLGHTGQPIVPIAINQKVW